MRSLLMLLFAAASFCGIATDNWAAAPEVRYNLLTLPSTRAAADLLRAPTHVAYENATLRACVERLAEHFRFAYWIDRHVDAERRVNLTLSDSSLQECLTRLAQMCDAEVGLVENVVTIAAPKRLAAMQYTAVRLHDQLSLGTPTNTQRAELRPLEWPMLTTPTELAAEIGRNWGFALNAALPHDLMNAGQLHACTLATQLTLLFGGFDKCLVGRQSHQLREAPLPAAGLWRANYPQAAVRAARSAELDAILAEFPGAAVSNKNGVLTVEGTTAAHLRLLYAVKPSAERDSSAHRGSRSDRPDAQSKRSSDPLAEQRLTFPRLNNQPVEAVIVALAKQLGFEAKWDPSLVAAQRMALVSLEANQDSLDTVLAQLADQAHLKIRRQGRSVSIGPSEKP